LGIHGPPVVYPSVSKKKKKTTISTS
jgi:hypothetical protein